MNNWRGLHLTAIAAALTLAPLSCGDDDESTFSSPKKDGGAGTAGASGAGTGGSSGSGTGGSNGAGTGGTGTGGATDSGTDSSTDSGTGGGTDSGTGGSNGSGTGGVTDSGADAPTDARSDVSTGGTTGTGTGGTAGADSSATGGTAGVAGTAGRDAGVNCPATQPDAGGSCLPGTQCDYDSNICACTLQGWFCVPFPFGDAAACPPTRPANGTPCFATNLLCRYGNGRACICLLGQWQCGGALDGG